MFSLTKVISLGPFASPTRLPKLREAGITHLLNVGEAPSALTVKEGPFVEVAWYPIVDLNRIPNDTATACLDALHRMVTTPSSRVYVHCIAGWNRSPTIVWLYLIACGCDPELTKNHIARRSIDAVPGHSRLVDCELIAAMQRHGVHFLPHSRPEVLEFV